MTRATYTEPSAGKDRAAPSRRDDIVRVAIDHFVRKGYDSTNMEEIAEAAGMSKGNLYNYISSKEELVYLIRELTMQAYGKQVELIDQKLEELGHTETLKYYIGAYTRHVDSMQDAYNFLNHVVTKLGREGRNVLFRGVYDVQAGFEKILKAGVASGEFKPVNIRLIAHNISGIGTSWAHSRWNLRKFISLDEYINQQTQFILQGIAAEGKSGMRKQAG